MIAQLGKMHRVKATLITTIVGTLGSLLITAGLSYLVIGRISNIGNGYIFATVIPLILVPITSYPYYSLINNLQTVNKKLTEMSQIDPLTGVLNRRELFDRGEREVQLAKRHGNSIGLMMIDFDHFKEINDAYGHLVGDKVLVAGAHLMGNLLRETDILSRYGGEEFVMVLPHAGTLSETAERVRLIFEDYTFEAVEHKVTVSIGYTYLRNDDESLDDLISRADLALYKSKTQGRNQAQTIDSVKEASD